MLGLVKRASGYLNFGGGGGGGGGANPQLIERINELEKQISNMSNITVYNDDTLSEYELTQVGTYNGEPMYLIAYEDLTGSDSPAYNGSRSFKISEIGLDDLTLVKAETIMYSTSNSAMCNGTSLVPQTSNVGGHCVGIYNEETKSLSISAFKPQHAAFALQDVYKLVGYFYFTIPR